MIKSSVNRPIRGPELVQAGEMRMLKIAIVENETEQAELLMGYMKRYSEERGITCNASVYADGLDFITNYAPGFDAVFMDIRMPLMDGIETAERLRRMDDRVILIFVTNLAQMAIKGYRVNALDFVVKPVSYFDFSLEMDKICNDHNRRTNDSLWIKSDGVLRRIAFSNIIYIEIAMHTVHVHLAQETLNFRGSLKSIENKLDSTAFSRCNNCYIVNFSYITAIQEDDVLLTTGKRLHISRTRKREFMADFTKYFSGGNP